MSRLLPIHPPAERKRESGLQVTGDQRVPPDSARSSRNLNRVEGGWRGLLRLYSNADQDQAVGGMGPRDVSRHTGVKRRLFVEKNRTTKKSVDHPLKDI